MANIISNVAIHDLQRVDDVYRLIPGNSAIVVTNTVQRLVDELHKLYARRPSKAYGKFAQDVINYPTSIVLKRYLEAQLDFGDLTLTLMNTLQKNAQAKAASTGGHVFFAFFSTKRTSIF
ncbi:hypothetical protein F4V91_10845 [Neorhizobium galegae]|uniref:Uncharacterized protein n=1 Tax=Neorhizobium galegae TaxID=399 RepID=A0A6A1TQK8_NEOGA|nr:nucleoid-associated protein [Neorhizobium galegae]KAB1086882.1 hypothetical protein F4V91_10845 [Neorhizobium galegae]